MKSMTKAQWLKICERGSVVPPWYEEYFSIEDEGETLTLYHDRKSNTLYIDFLYTAYYPIKSEIGSYMFGKWDCDFLRFRVVCDG